MKILEKCKTYACEDPKVMENNYMENSQSFGSKNDVHRSVSSKNRQSTEPHSKNQESRNTRIQYLSNAITQNKSSGMFTARNKNSNVPTSFDNYSGSCQI
jgi:hypothetical protein